MDNTVFVSPIKIQGIKTNMLGRGEFILFSGSSLTNQCMDSITNSSTTVLPTIFDVISTAALPPFLDGFTTTSVLKTIYEQEKIRTGISLLTPGSTTIQTSLTHFW